MAAEGCKLRRLLVRGVRGLTDTLLLAVAATSPLLTELDAGHSNPFGRPAPLPLTVPPRLQQQPQQQLHPADPAAPLLSRTVISDSGGRSVGDGIALPAPTPSYLTGLASAHPPPPSTSDVSDVGLAAVASACRGLTILRLQGRSGLTDGGVARSLALLPHLSSIDLRGCRDVGADTLAVLSGGGLWVGSGRSTRQPPPLRELNLAGCGRIDDGMLVRFSQSVAQARGECGRRRLLSLDVSGCYTLSLEVLRGVAAQRRFGEMRILRLIAIGRGVQIGDIQAVRSQRGRIGLHPHGRALAAGQADQRAETP